MPDNELTALVQAELAVPVPTDVSRVARAIAQKHGRAAIAVLFYGSCLRSADVQGLMLDFYLIVDDYSRAYPKRWMAWVNRLLPPNVFPFEHRGMAAKYAVLSLDDFRRLASADTLNISVWARFAQPSRLVWAASDAIAKDIAGAVAGAAPALLKSARPMLGDRIAPLDLWSEAFALTYAAELRAERNSRAGSIVDHEPERYLRFTRPALRAAGIAAEVEGRELRFAKAIGEAERRKAHRLWALRRAQGKLLSVLRLIKASATFAGGIDYLAWKINRHAGTRIEIRPWQRRFPLVGALFLLPKLIRSGAVR